MNKRDYYSVLGVERNADTDAIKRAYRKLAMKHHPDRNPGNKVAEERFKEVQEAYACLSDDEKRSAYNRFGHAAFEGSGRASPGPDFSSFFGDVFSDFFGGGGGRRPQRQQRVLEMDITFEEMVSGCQKDIRLALPVDCRQCDGSGSADGAGPSTCGACGGGGQTRVQHGPFAFAQTCQRCGGSGRVISDPCDSCDGSGKVQTEKKVSVNIPAGIQEDNLLRINVEGVGDELFLRVSIRPHPLFKRHGDDLHLEIPVSIVTAALGGEVTVPTVKGGHLSVTIPGGVQSGQVLRMSGAGVPNLRSGRRGNLMCQVTVETPVNLSAKQKDLLRELDDSLKNKHEPKKKSWLDQVKDLFTD